MPEARVGRAVHAALEHLLQGKPMDDAVTSARTHLTSEVETARFEALRSGVQAFLDRIDGFRRRRRVARELVEFSLAVREDLSPTSFYAGDAFYRGILDAGFVFDDDTLAVVDHKTGVRAGNGRIAEQLEGYAVLAAAYFRNIRRVWLGIHWVAEACMEWAEVVQPDEIRARLLPGVLDNIEAAALAVEGGPRPNPGSWCEWCSYRSICPAALATRFEPVDDDEPDPWT